MLAELPPGVSEIYCHPAVVDDEARRWRPADYDSEREVAALTSPRVRDGDRAAGIELITYRDLARSAAASHCDQRAYAAQARHRGATCRGRPWAARAGADATASKGVSVCGTQYAAYVSSSNARRCFLASLQSLHAGTTLPLVERPPRTIGTRWSMVSALAPTCLPQ